MIFSIRINIHSSTKEVTKSKNEIEKKTSFAKRHIQSKSNANKKNEKPLAS